MPILISIDAIQSAAPQESSHFYTKPHWSRSNFGPESSVSPGAAHNQSKLGGADFESMLT